VKLDYQQKNTFHDFTLSKMAHNLYLSEIRLSTEKYTHHLILPYQMTHNLYLSEIKLSVTLRRFILSNDI